MGVKLSLHLVGTGHTVVVSDVVLLVGDGLALGISLLARLGGSAVTADIVVCAHAVNQVVGGVLLARRVRDTSLVSVPVDTDGVATIARATSLAVDDSLGIEANRG